MQSGTYMYDINSHFQTSSSDVHYCCNYIIIVHFEMPIAISVTLNIAD